MDYRDKFISVNTVLIGTKTFKECYKENKEAFSPGLVEFACNVLNIVEDFVKKSLAVDAVEVVRCKDCNYYKKVKGAVGGWCDCELTPFDMDPDDFCSRGERRSE
jgi:hypothetical protein